MGKNILILAGSPRPVANSLIMAEAFAKAAQKNGHAATLIKTAQLRVGCCRACEKCWTGGKPCIQQDDMQKLYPQLNLADIIVFASPLYFYGLSAQLKAVIDRFYPLTKDDTLPAFGGKQCVLLLCGASEDEDDFEGAIRTYELICDYAGWEDCGVVSACGVTNPGDVKGTVWMDEVEALAGQF